MQPSGPAFSPMPWPWAVARHCLNMQSGDVVHWPYPMRSWRYNAPILTAMQGVWRAWQFFSRPAADWTPHDIDYYDWLTADD